MSIRISTPPVLVLAANPPWVYALGRRLADHASVTAIRMHDLKSFFRLKPQWPETKSAVRRLSIVMPPGYAGTLEPVFRPLMSTIVARERGRLRNLSGVEPVVIAPFPYLTPWLRGVPREHLVYYNLDEYPFYEPARAERILAQEAELIARAGLTLCLSAHQVRTLRDRNPMYAGRIRHFPLGVVEEFINPKLERKPLPRSVGYVGNLTERVDWSFVTDVVKLMPDANFHFVGRLDAGTVRSSWRTAREQVLTMKNVIYEGEVLQSEVPKHYWRYAANWMPYDIKCGFNIASCPTKIMDALASGRPFVATDIPEVQLYRDKIECVTTPAAAAKCLRRLLTDNHLQSGTARIAFAAKQTWSCRAIEFYQLLKKP